VAVGGAPPAGAVTPDELLDVALEAARAAAPILLERFGHERVLATKSTVTDLVSEADLLAEQAIRDVLASRVPDDAIVGEEGDDVAGSTGRRWVVDPLDGTVNYLYGIPQWCVSVACEGQAAVILDALRDECFTATAGGPARLGDRELRRDDTDDLGRTLVATGFGYDSERRALQATVVSRLLPRVRDIRRAGSAALDLAWTAAGRLDAYFEYGVNPWDTAAGELICSEAGLHVQRLEPGGGLPYGVLVAPPSLAGPLHDLVRAAG
jgi:myo-inositol-1(or 4)-monophosphatase